MAGVTKNVILLEPSSFGHHFTSVHNTNFRELRDVPYLRIISIQDLYVLFISSDLAFLVKFLLDLSKTSNDAIPNLREHLG